MVRSFFLCGLGAKSPDLPTPMIPLGIALFGRHEINLVDEFFQEDRLGDFALGNFVGAAGVDDRDVGDADEA
jgi:hypothetical protein